MARLLLLSLGPVMAQAEPPPRPALAIVGFASAEGADPRDVWMPTAIEEVLAARLRQSPEVLAIPTIRCHQAAREIADDPAAATDWARVTKLLGAQVWLRGTVSGAPSAVKLTLEWRDSRGEPPVTTALGPGKLFHVMNEATRWALTQAGATRIDAALEEQLFGQPCATISSLEYYAKSIRATRTDNVRDALYYAEQAVDYDPLYRTAQLHLSQLELRFKPSARATAAVRLRRLGEVARHGRDFLDIAEIEHAQGMLELLTRSFDSAALRFQSALEASQQGKDPYGQIGAMNSLCDLCLSRSPPPEPALTDEQKHDFERKSLREAAEWQLKVLAMLEQLNDRVAQAPAAVKLALIYEKLGQPEKALDLHKRTLAAAQASGSRRAQATAWMFLGQWHREQKQPQEGLEAFRHALTLADNDSKPTVHLALADLLQDSKTNDRAAALQHFQAAFEQLKTGRDLVNQLRCLRGMAELQQALGQSPAAIQSLEQALDVAHALGVADEAAIKSQLDEWKKTKP